MPSSLRVVRSVGELLVDINGQAAAAALRDSGQQLVMLDRIAGGLCVLGGLGGGGREEEEWVCSLDS